MEITDEKLRDFVSNLIEKRGLEEARVYISMSDYPSDIKKKALDMMKETVIEESLLAENGDVSDFGI